LYIHDKNLRKNDSKTAPKHIAAKGRKIMTLEEAIKTAIAYETKIQKLYQPYRLLV